jgi:hypothetical protein
MPSRKSNRKSTNSSGSEKPKPPRGSIRTLSLKASRATQVRGGDKVEAGGENIRRNKG